jgi:aryl-alcohol dehydrogenase-like predicted oxidoreductase
LTGLGPGQIGGMNQRKLGGVSVGAIGLGEMPLSLQSRPDEDRALATIHAALDAGVTLIDTADAYCAGPDDFGHGEALVARALTARGVDAEDVLVATKGGHLRDAGGAWPVDGSAEYLKDAAEASRRRLGVEAIGLYQHHRPDPDVPYAETMGALKDLLDAGTIRMAGISNASIAQIDEARGLLGDGLVSVQNEFSPAFRSSEEELRHCAEHGLAFLPWSPLGGIGRGRELGSAHRPFAEVAQERGVSPQRVCLAWMLSLGSHVVPIPGSSRPETIADSAQAADLELDADELARLGGSPVS